MVPIDERLLQIQAGIARRARRLDEQHRQPLRRRDDEVEGVVLLQRVVADAHRAARERAGERERLKRDRGRRARRNRDRLGLDGASVELEAHLHVVDGRRSAVDDAGRDGDALLSRKERSLRQHGRHREIGRLRVGDGHGLERRAFGQPQILVAHPAVALEVADHDDFARLQRRIREHALRELQRGRVSRCFGAELSRRRSPPTTRERSAVARTSSLRVGAEQNQRRVIAWP